ncbi:hypothetical protein SAMN05421664_2913 [Chryseobacterium soldanellicola]|uniref:Uncharacterized protein n=1 Tax=Chryseobacterium soldanellicola TaxID=311333 RepID=A0A1H1F7V3_9FLAO|nr:hypothetical protein SAMN05421664_2913 [Chryseobacterium soldanellicola]
MLTKTQIEQLELELQHIVSESKELDQNKNRKCTRFNGKPCKPLSPGRSFNKKNNRVLIFPQKVEFAGKSFQIPKMNIITQYIHQYNNGLGNKKTDKEVKNFKCRSCEHNRTLFKPIIRRY